MIELLVVITMTAILSAIIIASVTQYISKGKDSSVSGNLALLIQAGEVYYNGHANNFDGFCNPTTTDAIALKNAISQMPAQTTGAPCYISGSSTSTLNSRGVCCFATTTANVASWAACARKFTNSLNAYCVDSKGVKKDILTTQCIYSGLRSSSGVDSGSFRCP